MTTLTGDEGNNTLVGGSDSDILLGLGGDDILQGNDGRDFLYGGAGNDTLDGGNGRDCAAYRDVTAGITANLEIGVVTGEASVGTDALLNIEDIVGSSFKDVLTGNSGNNDFEGEGGDDLIDGQGGMDRAIYLDAPSGVTVSLTTGTANDGFGGTDTLTSIENITGSNFNDTLTGNAQNNLFWGVAGNNLIDGQGGSDTVYYYNAPAGATVNLTTGTAANGYGGTETLLSIENIAGSGFNDSLTGSAQNNYLWGYGGNDTFCGLAGNDNLDGGSGIDTANYGSLHSVYRLAKTASGWTVSSSSDGTDTLTSIERLQFSDKKIALDLDATGNAGQAMGFIGAIAPDLLNNTSVRGTIISMFDQGHTIVSLSQLALDLQLLPNSSNAALANAVFHNVVGGTATQDMTNELVGYIESYGQAIFLAAVASLHLNVDLVGLQQTGVEYLI